MNRLLILTTVVFALPAYADNVKPLEPGKHHQVLGREAGTWDCDVNLYLAGPDAPPSTYNGVETNTLLADGLYLRTEFSYDMDSRRFEGNALWGFDPRTKRYVGTWVDNFTSVPSQINAVYDPEKNALVGVRKVVGMNGQELRSKQVTQWLSDSRKKVQIFMVIGEGPQPQEIKLMEMTATRRK